MVSYYLKQLYLQIKFRTQFSKQIHHSLCSIKEEYKYFLFVFRIEITKWFINTHTACYLVIHALPY